MTIYLDRDFDATTIADLLAQVRAAAAEEWFQQLESEVWHTYRDLARADVKTGRSAPTDHPALSPDWFVESPFDFSASQALWEAELVREVTARSPLFHLNPKGE